MDAPQIIRHHKRTRRPGGNWVRLQLKQWTTAAHDQLDAQMSRLVLTRSVDYVVFLQTHHAAYSELLRALPASHWICTVIRGALADLRTDLEKFGVAPIVVSGAPEPTIHPLAAAYVVAGSHFGKHILRRRWAAATDPVVLSAGAYLGSDLLKHAWDRLMQEFDRITTPASLLPELGPDADRVFGLFQDCLTKAQGQEHADAVA